MPKKMQDKENVGHVSSQLPIFDVLWMNSNQLGPMQAEWVVHIFL